jgi:hypothetical protein
MNQPALTTVTVEFTVRFRSCYVATRAHAVKPAAHRHCPFE